MKQFLKPHHKSLLAFLFLLTCLLIALVGIPWQAQQAAQEQPQLITMMRPGGGEVAFFQDPNDTSMSETKWGEPVYPASFDGDVRDVPQGTFTGIALNVEFEPAGRALPDPNFIDPVRQTINSPNVMPTPSVSFAGISATGWIPPDTQGDVGPNHYIQAVNASVGIYNKTGTQLATFTFDTLFSGTGTSCDTTNFGDPVVLYDNVSGRWILSDFAWTDMQNGPYYECIAISKTADPVSGGWWLYGLRADDA
nr:hypothetical protein [Anaerolineales bacterium]